MDRFTKRERVLLGALIVLAGLLFFVQRTQGADLSTVAQTEPATKTAVTGKEAEADLVVHIAGEVFQPGVYALHAGARVVEAIQAAGGETNFADLEGLNLARQVVDGEQIIVPSTLDPPDVQKAGGGPSAVGQTAADGKVNINQADEAALESLTGIGPVKAQAIIDYRRDHPFQSIEEIQAVDGIGEKTFDKIREKITIN